MKAILVEGEDMMAVAHMGRNIPAHLRTALVERDQKCVIAYLKTYLCYRLKRVKGKGQLLYPKGPAARGSPALPASAPESGHEPAVGLGLGLPTAPGRPVRRQQSCLLLRN